MFNGMTEVVPTLDPAKFEVLGSDMQILNLKVQSAEKIECTCPACPAPALAWHSPLAEPLCALHTC